MHRQEIVLENQTGLHARPASMFVKEASKYKSEINLLKGEDKYNAKSIMGLLSMGASKGDSLVIEAEGEDEKDAVNSLIEFIRNLKE